MSNASKLSSESPFGHAQVAEWRTSKMGYKFDRRSDIWRLDGSKTINLGRMRDLNGTTAEGLRNALCRYAEELAAPTTEMALGYFNMYCDHGRARSVTVADLSNWRASLDRENEYKLGALKSFLIAWNEWGFPGVESDIVKYLDELSLRGNVKGKAVKRACPYSGPLSQIELGALLEWASNAFAEDILDLTQYAYFLTLVFTGRRSVQIRSLRSGDLSFREDANGHDYIIRFPRAKQQHSGFRKDFNPLSVTEDPYLVLDNQARASQEYVERALGKKLPSAIRKKIPVFLANDRVDSLKDIQDLEKRLDETPDFLHMTNLQAADVLHHVSVKNMARSERTGEFINFTSRRFRYTKGTNLARRGITGVALAHALDHTDTQNIDVYTANTEEMAAQIDLIMAPFLAPLAQAFAGVLIDSERDALRAKDPHSRVKNSRSKAIGNCGTHAFCASGYRACYTCCNFQPWRDAPHEDVLQEIQEERSRQAELGISPNVIQSTDRLLLAVQQVVLLCKDAQAKQSTGDKHV
ncbi:site-specific integrase [Rhodoferax sp.]|uniref:site-specific integrase n=1 Tax=Rhodoferax sp. TaxID=50421 RepID=UPI002719B286|nr:site-specific integrase [Rhodoferax sp.]MDO9144641.1 site-specific integrase [Rhodoferax sp.]